MKTKTATIPLGAHVSVAGGLALAFENARTIDADCLQIFVKNQRQWQAKLLADDEREEFRAAAREWDGLPAIAHASYLLNLASPEKEARDKSLLALEDELTRCEALGVPWLVLHPGAHMGDGEEKGLARIVMSLDALHDRTADFSSRILLETTAGQGTCLGHRFEHLESILSSLRDPDRVELCFDTCHVFAAGYDLTTEEGLAATLDEWETRIGLSRIRCFHLNDSRGDLGSRVDRHDHPGKGKIGKEGFTRLLRDPRFPGVPRILETPKGVDGRGTDLDVVNLRKLRRWVGDEGSR
jgi:deoxyribonuclease-4